MKEDRALWRWLWRRHLRRVREMTEEEVRAAREVFRGEEANIVIVDDCFGEG